MKPVHPLQDRLSIPFGSVEDFRALCESLKIHGLLEPIILFEDKVLDGRRRQQACAELEIPARYQHWSGECGSPIAYVLAKNVDRRHLSVTERALIAVKALPLLKAEAAERKKASQALPGEQAHKRRQAAPAGGKGKSAAQAARAAGVSTRTVEQAARVIEHGEPDLQEALRQGRVSVSRAAELSQLSSEEQIEAARQAESAPRRTGTDAEKNARQRWRTVARLFRLCDQGGQESPEEMVALYREKLTTKAGKLDRQ